MGMGRRPAALLRGGAFVAAYLALAEVGLPLRVDDIEASPLRLPSGLSLAAVLILGPRFWPAVAVAETLHTLWGGLPVTVAVALGASMTIEVLFAAFLMRGPGAFTGTLDNVRSVLALVLGGALLGTVPGALLSVLCLASLGFTPWSRFGELASTWWLGDAMGILILVPVALTFVTPRRWSFDRSTITAMALIGLSLVAACELAFGRLLSPASGISFSYLPFPVIFWASLRFGAHGAAISSGIAALLATTGTMRGLGPFAGASAVESLVLLETFMAVMVLTGLILGAVISERRSVAQALRDSQKRYDLASSAGRAGVWDWNLHTNEIYVDPVLKKILGYEDHEIENTMEAWGGRVHPDDVELVSQAADRHFRGEAARFEVEHRMLHRDGSIRWFLARGEAQHDAAGHPRRLTGTDVDITRQKRDEEALERGEQKIREQLSELEHVYQTVPIGLGLTDRNHRFVRLNERLASLNGRSIEEHIGRTVREIVPSIASHVEPTLQRVLETGEPEVNEIDAATPSWAGTALVGHYPLKGDDGDVKGVGVIFQDITPRKRAELLQAGNNRVLELVAKGVGVDEVMDVLARNVESHSGCRCLVRLMNDRSSALRIVAAPSLPRRHDPIFDVLPVGALGGTCGRAAQRRRPAVTSDVASDPGWAMLRPAAAELGIRSFWSVPILSSTDEVLGTVGVFADELRAPKGADLDVAENTAHLARVAIEHARAREALTKSEASLRESHQQVQHLAQRLIAAQEEERRRVSRELHDGLNQQLAALSFEIGKLRSRVVHEPGIGDRLSELQTRAVRLIDDARRMSHELHPSMLEHLGLVAAVRAHCDEVGRRGNVAVRFDPIRPPTASISPEAALCLFRVVQEGVRNAAKHSGASAVQVTLRSSGDSVFLAIADNGSGFDPSAERNGGLGLVSMAERVRAIGGEFRIVSNATEGTRLEVRLPNGTSGTGARAVAD